MLNEDKKTILIVEDDAFAVKAHQLRLEREGIAVEVVATGTEAMVRLEKTPPHVVLLDLMLPGASGFDILAAIKKSPTWKDVPAIILSNLGQPEDIAQAKSLGANEYLLKANVRIDDVVDVIRKYI